MDLGSNHKRRWGIAQALVLLVVIVLTPFILLEVYRGVQDIQRRRDSVTQQAEAQASTAAAATDDFLSFTERFLASLAGAPALQNLDTNGANALFQSVRAQNPTYENIFLVSLKGTQVASTEPSVSDPQVTTRSYFQQALSTGRMAVSGVLAWPGTGRSAVVLAYPVNAANGSPVGVLAFVLNISRLSTVIGYSQLPPNSIVLLAQEDGVILAANNEPTTWVGHTLKSFGPFSKQTDRRTTGTAASKMFDGVQRVVGFQAIARAPWIAVAGIPQAEVDAQISRSVERISEEIALAVLATVLLTWIMVRRVVTPIRTLAIGAKSFASGQLDHRIPVERRDELGDLSAALNSMAASLEQRLEEEAEHATALRQLNQLQAEFVATASHELRTPVTAIRSYAEALMRPDIGDEQIRQECLAGIERSSARLARLVQTLLDVSRIDNGQIPVKLGPVDAAATVQAAIEQSVSQAEHAVRVHAPAGLAPMLADRDRLEDVLANLLSNAVKYSPPDAPLDVAIKQTGDRIEIRVRDYGEGIAADELERVFDRFYQVQTGMARRTGGSGLGLYIARAYVTAMSGQIWAESEPQQGSTFIVALPVAPIETNAPGEEQVDEPYAGRARGRR